MTRVKLRWVLREALGNAKRCYTAIKTVIIFLWNNYANGTSYCQLANQFKESAMNLCFVVSLSTCLSRNNVRKTCLVLLWNLTDAANGAPSRWIFLEAFLPFLFFKNHVIYSIVYGSLVRQYKKVYKKKLSNEMSDQNCLVFGPILPLLFRLKTNVSKSVKRALALILTTMKVHINRNWI